MVTRDAAVLCMDTSPGKSLMLKHSGWDIEPETDSHFDRVLKAVEALLAECDGIFRSDWARKGAIAIEQLKNYEGAEYMAAFATMDEALGACRT